MRKILDLLRGRSTKPFQTRQSFVMFFYCCSGLGTNPPKTHRWAYFLYSGLVNSICVGLSPIIFNMGYVQDIEIISTMEVLSCLQAAINVVGMPIKVIALTWYLKQLRSVEPMLTALDARYTRPDDLAKIRKCVMMCNRIVVTYCVCYGMYETMSMLAGVVMHRAPLSLWMPFFDWRHSTLEYCAQVAFEAWLLFYILFHQVANDSYTALYIYAIRTHLQLLAARVRRLATDPAKSNDENYADLMDCIVTHQELHILVDTISPVISITVFVQFLIAAAVLSVTMINILIFADVSTQIASFVYYCCVTLQTLPCCYQASMLEVDSADLPVAIFQSNWLEQDRRYRQTLIFFMQRAQRNINFMAMKMFNINLNMNLSIAKFSFTLYTCIKEMDLGKKWDN